MVSLMVTCCAVAYVPAAGVKVGVATFTLIDPPPQPAAARSAAVIATAVARGPNIDIRTICLTLSPWFASEFNIAAPCRPVMPDAYQFDWNK
jgi:hypothetical protein